jgi:hypothetical protein
MAQQQFRTNGIYDKLVFPDYVYQEYPKWVTRPNGQRIIVQNLAEELKVAQEDPEGNAPQAAEQSEKAHLLQLLEQSRAREDALRAELNAKADEVDLPDELKVGDKPPQPTAQVGTKAPSPAKPK